MSLTCHDCVSSIPVVHCIFPSSAVLDFLPSYPLTKIAHVVVEMLLYLGNSILHLRHLATNLVSIIHSIHSLLQNVAHIDLSSDVTDFIDIGYFSCQDENTKTVNRH